LFIFKVTEPSSSHGSGVHDNVALEGEGEREGERSLLTIKKWLKVGKYNALWGNTSLTNTSLTPPLRAWAQHMTASGGIMTASTIPPLSVCPCGTPLRTKGG